MCVGLGDGLGGCVVGWGDGAGDGLGGLVWGGGIGAGSVLLAGGGAVVCTTLVVCLGAGLEVWCLVGDAGTSGAGRGVGGSVTDGTTSGVAGFAPTRPRLAGAGWPDSSSRAATPPPRTTMARRARFRSILPRNSGPRGRLLQFRSGPATIPVRRLRVGALDSRADRRNSRWSRHRARGRSNSPRLGGRGEDRRRRRRARQWENGGGPFGARGGVRSCTARRLPCARGRVIHAGGRGAPARPAGPGPGTASPPPRPPRWSGAGRRYTPRPPSGTTSPRPRTPER